MVFRNRFLLLVAKLFLFEKNVIRGRLVSFSGCLICFLHKMAYFYMQYNISCIEHGFDIPIGTKCSLEFKSRYFAYGKFAEFKFFLSLGFFQIFQW